MTTSIPELDNIVDIVLAYRPPGKKKKLAKKNKKNKNKTKTKGLLLPSIPVSISYTSIETTLPLTK